MSKWNIVRGSVFGSSSVDDAKRKKSPRQNRAQLVNNSFLTPIVPQLTSSHVSDCTRKSRTPSPDTKGRVLQGFPITRKKKSRSLVFFSEDEKSEENNFKTTKRTEQRRSSDSSVTSNTSTETKTETYNYADVQPIDFNKRKKVIVVKNNNSTVNAAEDKVVMPLEADKNTISKAPTTTKKPTIIIRKRQQPTVEAEVNQNQTAAEVHQSMTDTSSEKEENDSLPGKSISTLPVVKRSIPKLTSRDSFMIPNSTTTADILQGLSDSPTCSDKSNKSKDDESNNSKEIKNTNVESQEKRNIIDRSRTKSGTIQIEKLAQIQQENYTDFDTKLDAVKEQKEPDEAQRMKIPMSREEEKASADDSCKAKPTVVKLKAPAMAFPSSELRHMMNHNVPVKIQDQLFGVLIDRLGVDYRTTHNKWMICRSASNSMGLDEDRFTLKIKNYFQSGLVATVNCNHVLLHPHMSTALGRVVVTSKSR